jgi:uncharacterized protein YggE
MTTAIEASRSHALRATAVRIAALLITLAGLPAGLSDAWANVDSRLITVTGDADVRVPPDEVSITLGVETSDKDIATAARKNAEQVKQVLAMAREFKIDNKDIGTDQITIDKQFEYVNGKNIFKDYTAKRTVSLRLKELGRFEDLLIAAMKGGATSISGVQFCTSQLRKHRDQARAQALKAASEKAADMAKVLGQRVGKPRSITENFDSWSMWSSPARGAMYGNAQVVAQAAPGSSGDTPGVGLITVNAKVTVAFELE